MRSRLMPGHGDEAVGVTPRDIPRHFRERAPECERFAERTGPPHARQMMLCAASRWRAMADEDEQRHRHREPEVSTAPVIAGIHEITPHGACDLVCLLDEQLHNRAERPIFQGKYRDWHWPDPEIDRQFS
jgi:hypothetical protein